MINANVDQYIAKPWTPKLKWRRQGLHINRVFHQSKQSSETLFAQILLKRARSNMPKVKVVKKHNPSITDGDGHFRGKKLFFLPEFFVPGTAIFIGLRGRSSLARHQRNIIFILHHFPLVLVVRYLQLKASVKIIWEFPQVLAFHEMSRHLKNHFRTHSPTLL